MNKEETLKNVEILLDVSRDSVMERVSQFYSSGAVDVDEYDGQGFTLAKILLVPALKELGLSMVPLLHKARQDCNNLEYF